MKTSKLAALAALLALLLAVPMVLAEEVNASIDSSTSMEVKSISFPRGAEIRFLQLEKNITRNVLIGQATVEVITQNHVDANVSGMETTLNEMEALADEVKGIDFNSDRNVLATQYVELKKEAIDLTKTFRDDAKTYLDANDRQQIRDKIKDLDKNELEGMRNEISLQIRLFNSERVEALLRLMGVSNPELVQRIADGNTTLEEIKTALRQAYDDLNDGQKAVVNSLVKERVIMRLVTEKNILEKSGENLANRLLERKGKRLERLGEWMKQRGIDANELGFDNRAKRLEKVGEELDKISERITAFVDDRKARGRGE